MLHRYALSHLSDEGLLSSADVASLREADCLAWMIAHLVEVEDRRAYALAGYPSLRAYVTGRLGKTQDEAEMRIRAARAARDYPQILELVGAGRLHLTAITLLKPHLRPENAEQLLSAACDRSRAEIEQLLAEWFPKPDVGELHPALELAPDSATEPVPERVQEHSMVAPERPAEVLTTSEPVPERVRPTGRVTPLGQGRYGIEFTFTQGDRDLLRQAQELLGRRVQHGDLAQVFSLALQALVPQLEKHRHGASSRPRCRTRPSTNPRHIPAHIRRAVYERDQGQCTYVSDDGQRCEARSDLELDHIVPLARGGQTTVDNLRTRCRLHNQLAAEQAFGTAFMESKREQARRAAEERGRQRDNERKMKHAAAAEARECAEAENDPDRSVVPWLRAMGVRLENARRAAAACAGLNDAPMEQRVRVALARLGRGRVRRAAAVAHAECRE